MRYRAFLSYSRHDDRQAAILHRQLDSYRPPRQLVGTEGAYGSIPKKLYPVFRDRSDLAGGGRLSDRIRAALQESEALIVLCSPAAASSGHVDAEVRAFIELHDSERIFPVIAGNLGDSADIESDFFPPALRGRGLLATDLRQLELSDGKVVGDGWRAGRLKLIAGLLGIDPSQLTRRERQRARARLAMVAVGTVAGAGVIVALGALLVSLTWRPALNASERLEIRQGPKELSIYNRVGFAPRLELPIHSSDLAALGSVREESGGGLWYAERDGLRRWGVDLAERLAPAPRRAWLARLSLLEPSALEQRGRLGQRYPVGPDATLLDAQIAFLKSERVPSLTLWRKAWRLPNIAECRVPPSEDFADYAEVLLNQEVAETVSMIRGLIASARLDPAIDGEFLVRLLTLYGHVNAVWQADYTSALGDPSEPLTGRRIAQRFMERPDVAETRALGDLASAIANNAGASPKDRAWLRRSLNECGAWSAEALAALAQQDDVEALRDWSRARRQADQGRLALSRLARRGLLADGDVTFVLDAAGFRDGMDGNHASLVRVGEWLQRIAEYRGLPAEVRGELVIYAEAMLGAQRYDRVERALAVLAADGSFVDKAKLLSLLDTYFARAGPPVRSGGEYELMGMAASNGVVAALLATQWETERGAVASSIAPKVGLGAGMSVHEVLAYARMIVDSEEPILHSAIAHRWFEEAYREALDAGYRPAALCDLANAEAYLTPHSSLADLRRSLVSWRRNANARRAAIEVHAARLWRWSLSDRSELREWYRSEYEPEIKHDLADLLLISSAIGDVCGRGDGRSMARER